MTSGPFLMLGEKTISASYLKKSAQNNYLTAVLPYVEENLICVFPPNPPKNNPINFDSSYLIYIPANNWTPYADTLTYSVSNRSMQGTKHQKVI